jgi:6-pyruvoyltetrahydropterin/6-carboxytetrahydropterin synthase
MSFRLAVRDVFAAAHRIRACGGGCERLHGHNFAVELSVEGGEADPATGMLVDFAVIRSALSRVLAELDHHDLNAVPAFTGMSPSSEIIARHVFFRARAELSPHPVCVESVTVWESERASATYRETGKGGEV